MLTFNIRFSNVEHIEGEILSGQKGKREEMVIVLMTSFQRLLFKMRGFEFNLKKQSINSSISSRNRGMRFAVSISKLQLSSTTNKVQKGMNIITQLTHVMSQS